MLHLETTLKHAGARLLGMCVLALSTHGAQAQSVAPKAAVPAGGHAQGNGFSLGWTLGQAASATYVTPGNLITAGVQQPEGVLLSLNVRVLLDGPFRQANMLMHDSLRTKGLLPLHEPYTALGLPAWGMGPGPMPAAVLQTQGPDAIVDWVYVELRPAADPAFTAFARAALVQRDGDVVDSDGVSPLRFNALPGQYHVLLRHRNHLPVMTLAPLALDGQPTFVDLSDGSTPTFGTDAQRIQSGKRLLWAGNTIADGTVRYTGLNNDRDPILGAVGGNVPTATATGYLLSDSNLDGTIKYVGSDNDRDPILITVGGNVPTAVRHQQLP